MSLLKFRMDGITLLRSFFILLVFALISPFAVFAAEPTVTPLGDYGNVAVMEFTGNLDSNLSDGTFNYTPRKLIAQKFYESHKDEYDFIVILSNFTYQMPQTGAKAFYSSIRNAVTGIGAPIIDYTDPGKAYYGLTAQQVQGFIDMGNLAGLTSDPLDPNFEETLMVLSHEMMHRWGAYVKFKDANGNISSALLGKDNAHWSYLFETNGSVLYGNHWQDNGDGTFTSIEPDNHTTSGVGRILNPLDLYLMGFYDKTQVPPMLLIDNPAIDKTQAPKVGDTITGTATSVTIDQITDVAAMGERSPSAAETSKTIRMAFIYLTTPGTFNSADLYGIEAIQNEWMTRFMVLTDGKGTMKVAPTPSDPTLPTNPGVPPPAVTPRTTPFSLDEGVAWLTNHQQSDGHWEDLSLTAQRDTTETLITLKNFSSAQQNYLNGVTWLASSSIGNTDYLSRTIQTLAAAGQNVSSLISELVARQNTDGGWGSRAYYMSNPADTALALKALTAAGYNDTSVIAKTINYLTASQNPDGGWSPALDQGSSIQPSAAVLSALNVYRSAYQLESAINSGMSWLTQKQNSDGGFGNSPSTVYDTAVAVLSLRELAASTVITNNGLGYLKSKQTGTGSWNESAYQTAVAVHTLWKAQVDPDLSIVSSDITFIPATITSIPATIAINANIWNLGKTGVSQATVALFDGDPALGNKLSEQVMAFPGQSATIVTFSATISDKNEHMFFVSVDPGNQINESNETNNIAWKTITADIPAPKVTITSPGSGTISTPTPQLLYTVTPDTATVTVTVDGVVVNKVSGNYLDSLSNAPHTVRVEATDGFSTGYADVNFTVDFSPPVVTIPSPVNGVYSENNPLLLYQVSKTASVTVKVDGLVVNTVSGNRLSALADGAHTVRVEAIDSGGTTGYGEVSFIVSTGTQVPYGYKGSRDLGSNTIAGTAADALGNVYVVSYSGITLWVTKYDQTENVVWETPLSSNNGKYLYPTDIAVDSEGSAYVGLWTIGGIGTYGNLGFQDAFLVKFSNVGAFEWAQRPMATTGGDFIYSVSIGRDGYIYVGGFDGYADAYWAKYDKTGVKTGGEKISIGTYNLPAICEVAADVDGNVYMSGYTNGNITGNASKYPNAGAEDYYVVSYDKNSALRWAYQGGTSGIDRVAGIGVDALGGVYVSGTTEGALEGNTSKGSTDAFIAKFSSDGLRQWTSQLGSTSWDNGNAIEVEKNGVLYLAGTTGGTFAGADGSGGIFVIKGDGSGSQFNQHWVKQFGTSTGSGEDISLGTPGLLLVREGNILYTLRDPRLPEVALDHDPMWTNTESRTITGTITAGAQVQVTADTGGLAGVVTYPTSTAWQCTVSGLVEGTNNITVTAKNSGGFQYTISGTITRDSVAPTVSITSPWNWQTYYDKPVLEYTVSDGSVKVMINGVEVYKQSGHTLDSLSSGENTIRVEATDEAGNVGFAEIVIVAQGAAVGELPNGITATTQFGSTGYETVTDFARDSSGNLYITGYTDGNLDGNINAGGYGAFIVKYDSLGNRKTWLIGSADDEYDTTIAVDTAGNMYAAWTVEYLSPSGTNYTDIKVAKYNSQGVQQWIQTLGSKTYDGVSDIAVDASGNVFVVGYTDGTLNSKKYGGNGDFFVVKYNSAGRAQWTVESGKPLADHATGVAVDAQGNIYVTGQTGDTLNNETSTNSPFIIKYNTSGVQQWGHIMDSQHTGAGKGVVVDGAGNIYVTGHFDTGDEPFAAKYDNAGNRKWIKSMGAGAGAYAQGVAVDSGGNVFVTGYASGAFDGNAHFGATDIFLVKFDNSGQEKWSQQYGTSVDDKAMGIVIDGSGNVWLAGNTGGTLGQSSGGGSDLFLMKLVSQAGP